MRLIDSHCHLDLAQFDKDRDDVVRRAWDAGVRVIMNPGIDLDHSQQAIALAEQYASQKGRSDVYAAVGVHPNSSHDFSAETAQKLRMLAAHPRVVAIGEIGLDYYWDKVDPEQQKRALREQLSLATELGLPVIIHSRDSNDDAAEELRRWVQSDAFRSSPLAKRPYAGVLHAFSGDAALAEEAYKWGFVLSLGGPVTFRNAQALHELVPQLRLDRLMLETDAPFLTPHPYRKQRNEPAYVRLVCEQLAILHGVSADDVAAETASVAERFFGLEKVSGVECDFVERAHAD